MMTRFYICGVPCTMNEALKAWRFYASFEWDKEHAEEVFALATYEDHPLAEESRELLLECGVELTA